MNFEINKATRELIWTKTALMSPSGGGKTYSALRLATGMLKKLKELGQEKNGKIILANTESSRGYYYASEFDYDIVNIAAPHSPEKYVELINFVVEKNYPILILDSTSMEWEGKGGCLELHQAGGGTFQAWAKVTPRHDKFIQAIADSPIHVIATMRAKDSYEIEKSENGKTNVKKLGVGAQQRSGYEYEFTCTFSIDRTLATVQKDNTHIFQDSVGEILSESSGEKIIEWANSGEGYTPPIREVKVSEPKVEKAVVTTKTLKENVVDLAKQKISINKVATKAIIKKFTDTGNPKNIESEEDLQALLVELKTVKSEEVQPDTRNEQA